MKLNRIHQYHHPQLYRISQTAPHRSISNGLISSFRTFTSLSCSNLSPISSPFTPAFFKISSVSKAEASFFNSKEQNLEEDDDAIDITELNLAQHGVVHQNTLRLVECSMLAAVTGLVYFLSNSLSIENYFGCFFFITNCNIFDEMGRWSWEENNGGNGYASVCLVWSIESFNISANTWSTWCHNGFFMEVESRLGSFNMFVHNCSSDWCRWVCIADVIFNKRKHTCFDHHKHSCISDINIYCHWCQFDSINECDIYLIWYSGIVK